MQPVHVFLIPGFFGFVNFGRLVYFTHVANGLAAEMRALGVEPVIHPAAVPPTASLRARSAAVARQIHALEAEPDAPIVLIGHSSGGLDARLLATPGVDLGLDFDFEPLAARVQAVVTVASPHHGTPLASLFVGLLGQKLLRMLSLITVELLRGASLPLSVLARIGAVLARARLPGGKIEAIFEHLHDELLGLLPVDERDVVNKFFADIGNDQALMAQITPDGADLFAASFCARPGVRYGSVVALAPPPSLRRQLSISRRAEVQGGYMLYRWLHRATAMRPKSAPVLEPEQVASLRAAFGRLPEPRDSDAIVPTLSQVHREVVWAGFGDHLDLIGHFHAPRSEPPHYDWLMTHAEFGPAAFRELWSRVARFVVGEKPEIR
jgi:triacylglycerol lipase